MISISHWGMYDGGWAEAVDRERKRMFRQESGHYSCDVEVWAERIKEPDIKNELKRLQKAYLRAWCEASQNQTPLPTDIKNELKRLQKAYFRAWCEAFQNQTPLPTWPDDYNKEYIFD